MNLQRQRPRGAGCGLHRGLRLLCLLGRGIRIDVAVPQMEEVLVPEQSDQVVRLGGLVSGAVEHREKPLQLVSLETFAEAQRPNAVAEHEECDAVGVAGVLIDRTLPEDDRVRTHVDFELRTLGPELLESCPHGIDRALRAEIGRTIEL